MLYVPNHARAYRPLRGGVGIINPNVNEYGTLGFLATADGQDRWIVSCYHVLCRVDGGPFADGEPIYQLSDANPPVAEVRRARANAALDCAAALVMAGIDTTGEVLGLGSLAPPKAPMAGMRVIKSGYATGITEGIIRDVTGDHVQIEVTDDFPGDYELSERGDSGALWVERSSGASIALHTSGNDSGVERAFGVAIKQVLEVLGLRPL